MGVDRPPRVQAGAHPVTGLPPFRRLDPDDPRAQLDAPPPELVDVVAELRRTFGEVQAQCVRLYTEPGVELDWAEMGDQLAAAARLCRQQVIIEER